MQLTSSALQSAVNWQQNSCSSAHDYSIINLETKNKCNEKRSNTMTRTSTVDPEDTSRTPLGSKYAATHTPSLDIKTTLHMDSCKSLGIKRSIGRAAQGCHKEKMWQSQNEPSAVLDSSTMQLSLPTLGVRSSSTTHPPQPLLSTQQLFWHIKFYQY